MPLVKLLGAGCLLMFILLAIQVASQPKVTLGMDLASLQRAGGEPAGRYTRQSLGHSPARGYLYNELGSSEDVPGDRLPPPAWEAWHFRYGILGTTCLLVYVGADGKVARVFYGGT